jgi:hypothetical protein
MSSGRPSRIVWLALGAVCVVVAVAIVSASAGSRATPARSVAAADRAVVASEPARRAVTITRLEARLSSARARSARSGALPQTHTYPSAADPRFKSLMALLWAGIVRNSTAVALPAFFPQGAYVQLKQIPSAGSDWQNRLVHDYTLDIAAAHALLGHDPRSAKLLAVEVPSSYGHWIPPGVCYNDIGYYEMPNARVVYRQHGAIRSFGIASMISWRGVWYVVHLGAILRPGDSGEVDEPAAGRGRSLYSGTC